MDSIRSVWSSLVDTNPWLDSLHSSTQIWMNSQSPSYVASYLAAMLALLILGVIVLQVFMIALTVLCYGKPVKHVKWIPMQIQRNSSNPNPSMNTKAEQQVVTDNMQLSSAATMKCINPANGQILGYVPDMNEQDVDLRVQAAKRAQIQWFCEDKEEFHSKRIELMRTLLAFVDEHQREICEVSCKDTGKVMLEASLGEIITTMEKLRWIINHGKDAIKPERRDTGPLSFHRTAHVEFIPLGVIAAISPWNYPFHNFMNPLISSLFAGNALVVKPSEHSSWSTMHYVQLIHHVLASLGHNPDLVQIVTGGPKAGEAVVNHPAVDKIFFTGSTKVGKAVARAAASRLAPVVLELGGKDPFIVFDDADWKMIFQFAMRGVFQNSGQNCIGIERIFVQDTIFDAFVNDAFERIKCLRQGTFLDRNVDLGAMTMGEHELSRIQGLVDDAVAKGARLLHGGKPNMDLSNETNMGAFFMPTLLAGVTTNMKISQEEVFGPVMAVFKFIDEDDLITQVNTCPFGLGSSIMCGDRKRAERLIHKIRAGMTNVNEFATNYLIQSLPFGGTKDSGSDRFAGIEGLRGCCLMKTVTRDRFPGFKMAVPKPMLYPVAPNSYEFSETVISLTYRDGILKKLALVVDVVLMLMNPKYIPKKGLESSAKAVTEAKPEGL